MLPTPRTMENDRYGYFNPDGSRAFEADFMWADNFYDGLARIQFDYFHWGYIRPSGEIAHDFGAKYTVVENFNYGLAFVKFDDDRYGYINRNGEIVFESRVGAMSKEGITRSRLIDGRWVYFTAYGLLVELQNVN